MTWRTFAACASFVLGGILLMSACGSSSGKKSAATTASPSGGGGTFEICTDPEDPPFESMSGGKYVGADIEFGQKVATALGKSARFTSVGFDGLIAAVQSHKCDAIISAMSDTPERAKQVTFVDYVQIPQATMIRKSNTEIKTLADLSGKTVSVLVGTRTNSTS
jgi:ABC-type amino acid transport substrate-binding protein